MVKKEKLRRTWKKNDGGEGFRGHVEIENIMEKKKRNGRRGKGRKEGGNRGEEKISKETMQRKVSDENATGAHKNEHKQRTTGEYESTGNR